MFIVNFEHISHLFFSVSFVVFEQVTVSLVLDTDLLWFRRINTNNTQKRSCHTLLENWTQQDVTTKTIGYLTKIISSLKIPEFLNGKEAAVINESAPITKVETSIFFLPYLSTKYVARKLLGMATTLVRKKTR